MTEEKKLEYPQSVTIPMVPVGVGRVQVLTRISPEDKNDLVRVVNITEMNQQDVMRIFLVRGIRQFLADHKAMLEQPKPSEENKQSLDPVEGTTTHNPRVAEEDSLDIFSSQDLERMNKETAHPVQSFDPDKLPGE